VPISSETLHEVTRETRKWVRYYQSLGFSSLTRTSASQAGVTVTPQIGSAPTQPCASRVLSIGTEKPQDTAPSVHKEFQLPKANSPVTSDLSAASSPGESLASIRKDLGDDCQRCKLAGGRKTIVFGSGNEHAEIVFVGEGPGADEDEQGLPFVGRAGQLLTDMIEKGLKISRSQVYICNIVKCRPPQNRKPEPEEVAACRPFVERQIRAIQPKVICALGATAAETLLGLKESMGRLRGKQYEFEGIPLIVTYHPAFLLRDPSRKADTWADLKMVMALLKK
jgi:uracil-DNA glycosylase